jgi:ribosomal protein L29
MKKTDKISYQQKPIEELQKELLNLSKQLVENRAKHRLGNLKDTSVFKKLKYQISLIKTVLSKNQKND